ncbi:hypothetical protein MYX75_01810 [Acidobacteria bacterium AH-259-A15]|nr:hypothetical protein [Acidobacteria bacterium AH-259-A15]
MNVPNGLENNGGKCKGRRKHRFIDKKQQLRFAIIVIFVSWLFPLFFLCLVMSPPFSNVLIGGDAQNVQPLLEEFIDFCFDHWWVVMIALVFIGLCSVLLSHLMFGPMRRFENVLLQKKENPLETVNCHLRQSDYFHDFSKLLEEVLNELEAVEAPAQVGANKDAEAYGAS